MLLLWWHCFLCLHSTAFTFTPFAAGRSSRTLRMEVDLSARDAPLAFDDAMRQHGFCLLHGHGVPKNIRQQLYQAAMEFFALPIDRKMEFCISRDYSNSGYHPIGTEAVARSKQQNRNSHHDHVESITVGPNTLPDLPDHLLQLILTYKQHLDELLQKMLRLSEEALGLDSHFFDECYSSEGNTIKLSFYPATKSDDMLYGPHTDYSGFTILLQDDVGGLEVFVDNDWVPISPEADSFVINCADLIERWTNGLWKSNLHRVMNVKSRRNRLSIVYFTSPDFNAVIEPISNLNGDPKFTPVRVSEYLYRKLNPTSICVD